VKLPEQVERTGQLGAVACAGQIVSYVFYIVLARRTGVSVFEDYVVAVGAVTVLASFTTLGLEKYAVRILPVLYERGDWAGARGYLGFALRRTLWTSVAAGVALALGWTWRDPWSASWAAIAAAALVLPVVSLAQLGVEVLTAGGRELRGTLLHRVGAPGVALALVLLSFQLPVAFSGAAAVVCLGLGWAFALAGMALVVRRTAPAGVWVSSPRAEPAWQREALPFLAYSLALNAIAQAGVLGLEFLRASEADLGAYAAAAQTANLLVVLATATNRFYTPRLSLLLERGDFASIDAVRRQRMRWVIPVIAVFLVVVLGFGREILGLFRPEFVDEGVPVLRILVCSTAFSVLFSIAPTYLTYARRNRLLLGTTAGAAGVQVLLLFALVPSLGATGAAIAYATAMVGMYAVFAIFGIRELAARSSASRK
jgi:O-antigen/teichoic acid export membrane protein